jgi:DNA-binding beta-propeller fold protein YncE
VGNTTSSTVSVIDAAADALVESVLERVDFPGLAGMASFAVPGGRALVLVTCAGDDTLQIVDVDAGHTILDTVPRAADEPGGIVALRTQLGSRAYFTDSLNGEIGQIDLDLLDATGLVFPLPAITGLPTGISIITSSSE